MQDAGIDFIRDPNFISSEEGAEALYSFIVDHKRAMPVIVVSERKNNRQSLESEVAIEPAILSNRLYGLAHVFYLPEETSWRFCDLISREWAVYNGSLRYYRANFDANKDPFQQHPLALFETIQRWGGGRGAHAFASHIVRQAFSDSISVLDAENRVPSFNRIKNWILSQRMEQNASATGQVQNEDFLARIGGLEQEVKDVWGIALEQEQKVRQLQDDLALVTTDRDNLLNLVAQLRADNQKLGKRKQWQAATVENTYPTPETLDDLNEWVERYFPDRLQLTRRALSSARKSVYVDVPRIYQSLILIATGYHDVLFNGSPQARQVYERQAENLKVEISKTFVNDRPTDRSERYYTNGLKY